MGKNTVDVMIVGAGLSGLCTAHFLHKQNPELTIQLLEKSERAGGAIRSMQKDGFLAEWGPHGFLDNIEENRELLDDLNLTDQIQKAPLKQFVRFICLNGKLVKIPQTPPAIIKSNIMSLPAKIRVLADLWKKPRNGEQTIAQWAEYRFGKAMLPFADIAMTGTFAGDIEKLSIDAAMPGLRRLEKTYGSVFKGAINARKMKPSTGGMPSMISFESGMEFLIKTLVSNKNIHYQTPVDAINLADSGWNVLSGDQAFTAKQLILALPVNQALDLLHSLEKPPRAKISEAVVHNVVLGFKAPTEIPFGFGYLAPKTEKRFALGTLFSVHMFPKRAPDDLSLIEVLVGGVRNPEYLLLEDKELVNKALQDVRQLIHLPQDPVFSTVLRPNSGIPQLELGHLDLVAYTERLQNRHKGLFICGFGWEGIGINDMIKQAKKTATNAVLGMPSASQPARAKPIYF